MAEEKAFEHIPILNDAYRVIRSPESFICGECPSEIMWENSGRATGLFGDTSNMWLPQNCNVTNMSGWKRGVIHIEHKHYEIQEPSQTKYQKSYVMSHLLQAPPPHLNASQMFPLVWTRPTRTISIWNICWSIMQQQRAAPGPTLVWTGSDRSVQTLEAGPCWLLSLDTWSLN